jgi:predicted RNA-binding protein with PUA-like domain
MRYWLMKSEPGCFSIDTLKENGTTSWDGVRNYQARNFMMNDMSVGDKVFFYHSNTEVPAVVGLAEVCKEAYPDTTALDRDNMHYDPKATPEKPIWCMVDVKFLRKFEKPVTLREIKDMPELSGMKLVKGGMRLSVQPVTEEEFFCVMAMAGETL